MTEVTSESEPQETILYSSHRLLDNGVFKWQPKLIPSATVAVDKRTYAVALFFSHL